MEPTTIRVRIAVAVSASGQWGCDGGSRLHGGNHDDEFTAKYAELNCSSSGPKSVHFIEADIPLPVAVTVEGTVTSDR